MNCAVCLVIFRLNVLFIIKYSYTAVNVTMSTIEQEVMKVSDFQCVVNTKQNETQNRLKTW